MLEVSSRQDPHAKREKGYNQGVFSGILTMPAFERHMGDYIQNKSKMGWLTAILELGAWVGALSSGYGRMTLRMTLLERD